MGTLPKKDKNYFFLDDHIYSGVTLRVAISDRRNSKPLYNIFSFSSLLLFFRFFFNYYYFITHTTFAHHKHMCAAN